MTNIAKLEKLIAKREDEKEGAIEVIADTKKEITNLEDMRTAAHGVFLDEKKADEDAVTVLTSAKGALTKYDEDHKIKMGKIQEDIKAALVLRKPGSPEFKISEDQAPDANFQHESHTKQQSKGIFSILTMIIEDLGAEIKHSIADEVAAQAMFEESVAKAKALIKELEDKIKELNAIIATRNEEKTEEHKIMQGNHDELADEFAHKKEITPDCDWILNAFVGRAQKRDAEAEGLTAAKAFLAGAAPSMLQQVRIPLFNDEVFPCRTRRRGMLVSRGPSPSSTSSTTTPWCRRAPSSSPRTRTPAARPWATSCRTPASTP